VWGKGRLGLCWHGWFWPAASAADKDRPTNAGAASKRRCACPSAIAHRSARAPNYLTHSRSFFVGRRSPMRYNNPYRLATRLARSRGLFVSRAAAYILGMGSGDVLGSSGCIVHGAGHEPLAIADEGAFSQESGYVHCDRTRGNGRPERAIWPFALGGLAPGF